MVLVPPGAFPPVLSVPAPSFLLQGQGEDANFTKEGAWFKKLQS